MGWNELGVLRELCDTIGAVSEAQIQQIKIWQAVVFGMSAETELDINRKKLTVKYDSMLVRWSRGKEDRLRRGARVFCANVHSLLGKTWEVEIVVNGKVMDVGDE